MFLPVRWGAPVRACKRGPDAQKEKRRKANSKRRYAGLRVPNPQTGAPHRGQNKSRFRLEAAHLVQKTKCTDFNMKSAAVGRFFAHCNRKSLAAANTQSRFSASNTVLLTCVIGNPPCAHILPSHRSSLQWRTFVLAVKTALAWPHAHSTVSCRHFCLLPCLSYSKERCGHGVYYGISIFSFTVNHRP